MADDRVAGIIRHLEQLQDEQEQAITDRLGVIGEYDLAHCEPARLLGIAVGLADGYRKAAELLRGGPRPPGPGALTFRGVGPVYRVPLKRSDPELAELPPLTVAEDLDRAAAVEARGQLARECVACVNPAVNAYVVEAPPASGAAPRWLDLCQACTADLHADG